MNALEILLNIFAAPFYPATLIFMIACIRALLFKKQLGAFVIFIGVTFAILPSSLAIGFVAYDLIVTSSYDQHGITAIVLTYAGIGIIVNLISSFILTLYLLKKRKTACTKSLVH